MKTIICDFRAAEAASREPVWTELPFGVQLQLRARTGLVSASVEAQLAREIGAFREGEDVIGRYGFSAEDAGLLADEHIRNGFAMLLHACILGMALIVDWNLVDEAGDKIPITPESLRAFFQHGPIPGSGSALMAAFQRHTDAPARRLEQEKKGFAALPSGGTAAGSTTAKRVGNAATRAPTGARSKASAARKSTTPPKRPKASQH